MANFNLNKSIIGGRLTADPELKQTASGVSVCSFTVAVNRRYAKDGNQEADFINCVAWRSTAEFISRYFSKGSMIIVDGQLRNNDYTDNNGVKHYSMEVLCDEVHFGESKNAGAAQQGQPQYGAAPPPKYNQQYQAQPPQYGAALPQFDTLPPPNGNPHQR